jgi:hypothetical protein
MIRTLAGGAGIQTVPITDCAVTPEEDIIAAVLAHHVRRERHEQRPPGPDAPARAGRYRPESLRALFGQDPQ